MAFNFGVLGAAAAALAGVLRDLNLDEREIQNVIRALTTESADLGDNSFHRGAKVNPASFGGSETAQALGGHHDRAYMVIDETIRGMVRDLETFRDSVRTAVDLVTTADETAASDLEARRQRVVNVMTHVVRNSAGDQANQEARNNQPVGSDA